MCMPIKRSIPFYPGRAAFSGGLPGIEIALAADPAQAFPELDYAQIRIGPPFGQPARELYWENKVVDFNPGDSVCLSVTVDNNTDFSAAGDIRIRPDIAGCRRRTSTSRWRTTVCRSATRSIPAMLRGRTGSATSRPMYPITAPGMSASNAPPQAGTISGVSLEMKQR